MSGDFEADPPVWIWQSEGSGIAVETDLLDAARRNWPRVLSYAQRYQQDSSVVATRMERKAQSGLQERGESGHTGERGSTS